MKMNLKLLMVAAAAFVALAVPAGQAVANSTWEVATACGSGHRISHQNASCLSAGWDNSPGFWSGVAGGSTYWVQSKCSTYGLVYASVDSPGALDDKWKLSNGNKEDSVFLTSNVASIDCCINHGDQLCYKWQVEKNGANKIRHVTVTGSGYSSRMVNVSTHKQRYNFCKSNPDYIYCEINPEGDAFTSPYNCGDHYCTVGDCTWHWNRSTADDTCHERFNPYSMSISAEDGTSQTCTIQVKCESHIEPAISGGGGYMIYELNELSAPVWDFDNLANCSGTLQVGAC